MRHRYTSHGHACCDQVTDPKPDVRARCGGVKMCTLCSVQGQQAHEEPIGFKKEPDKVDILILEYAKRLETVYALRTAGDFTFDGILSEFLRRALTALEK